MSRWQQGYSSDDLSALKELVSGLPGDTTGERVKKRELEADLEHLNNAMSELESALAQQCRDANKIEELDKDLTDARETLDNVTLCLKEISKNEALWEQIVKALPETANDLARFLDSGVLNFAVKITKPSK